MRFAKWVSLPAFLSAQTPPSDAVSVRSVAIEAPTIGRTYFMVTIGLENRSKKSITAFRVSLTSTFEDGSRRKQQDGFVDLLPLYIIGQPVFRPGETYQYTASVHGAPEKVEVQMPAVAFDDHTVLGSPLDASWLITRRTEKAWLLERVVEVLKTIVQSPDPQAEARSRERSLSSSHLPNERDTMLYSVLRSTQGDPVRIEKFISDSESCVKAMSSDYVTWSIQ